MLYLYIEFTTDKWYILERGPEHFFRTPSPGKLSFGKIFAGLTIMMRTPVLLKAALLIVLFGLPGASSIAAENKLAQEEEQPRAQESESRDSGSGNWALGGLYSGGALKYVTGGKSAWELRAQSGSGILALGSRYYRYFTRDANPRLFYGIEGDYITFKGEESKGAGFAGGAFLGGEIFLTKQLGLLADVGPMYINLADSDYSQSAGNMEYVLNMALYWHFR